LFGLYRFGLYSGYFRWVTRSEPIEDSSSAPDYRLHPVIKMRDRDKLLRILGEEEVERVLNEADEIVEGNWRLFRDKSVPLELRPPEPLVHWSIYEQDEGTPTPLDVKLVWEPARFGWAYSLGRAYFLSGDERYAATFWDHTEVFWNANPAYLGLNWASAQEVALRTLALVFAGQVFAPSVHSTLERMERLAISVATHARRIPPTLIYARAQNNNHLLSEAVGLLTASLFLPDHPDSNHWRRLGWHWFNRGIQTQIDADGAYTQHSTNYHRLMLQLALWVNALTRAHQFEFPRNTQQKLADSTRWLMALSDPKSGRVPNLGPNDGAYILPLTVCSFSDYRPVLAAASLAFLGERNIEAGIWDEMTFWLVSTPQSEQQPTLTLGQSREGLATPHVLEVQARESWAYLRAASFNSRPGHADQLHLDLWWRGLNLAQDAGSYRYNAPEPWSNSLARTAVHNTLTVNGQDQMTLVGRFLWLDWAQASVVPGDESASRKRTHLVAEHNGYRYLGLTHQRTVIAKDEAVWIIEDRLLFTDPKRATKYLPFSTRLHWLLPDWPWQIKEAENRVEISLQSSYGRVRLLIQGAEQSGYGETISPLLVRAGETLYGSEDPNPTWGWISPTYGSKIPALSFSGTEQAYQPLTLVSIWRFS